MKNGSKNGERNKKMWQKEKGMGEKNQRSEEILRKQALILNKNIRISEGDTGQFIVTFS